MKAKQTKEAAFLKRAEALLERKNGPERERIRAAIRIALATPGRGRRLDGGPLAGALHCMSLARIDLRAEEGHSFDVAACPEPEHVLVFLAQVGSDLAEVLDAVAREIDHAESRRAA